jgi:hypothetical protein
MPSPLLPAALSRSKSGAVGDTMSHLSGLGTKPHDVWSQAVEVGQSGLTSVAGSAQVPEIGCLSFIERMASCTMFGPTITLILPTSMLKRVAGKLTLR